MERKVVKSSETSSDRRIVVLPQKSECMSQEGKWDPDEEKDEESGVTPTLTTSHEVAEVVPVSKDLGSANNEVLGYIPRDFFPIGLRCLPPGTPQT